MNHSWSKGGLDRHLDIVMEKVQVGTIKLSFSRFPTRHAIRDPAAPSNTQVSSMSVMSPDHQPVYEVRRDHMKVQGRGRPRIKNWAACAAKAFAAYLQDKTYQPPAVARLLHLCLVLYASRHPMKPLTKACSALTPAVISSTFAMLTPLVGPEGTRCTSASQPP